VPPLRPGRQFQPAPSTRPIGAFGVAAGHAELRGVAPTRNGCSFPFHWHAQTQKARSRRPLFGRPPTASQPKARRVSTIEAIGCPRDEWPKLFRTRPEIVFPNGSGIRGRGHKRKQKQRVQKSKVPRPKVVAGFQRLWTLDVGLWTVHSIAWYLLDFFIFGINVFV